MMREHDFPADARGRNRVGRNRVGPNRVGKGQVGKGRMRLQTLVLIRWVAIAGQTVAILVVRFGFGFDMQLALVLAVVAASAIVNIFLAVRYPASTRLSDSEAALYLAFDTLQLAVLLFLTGGVLNPFSILVLVPVIIAATTLSLRSTIWLGVVTLVSLSILSFFHLPLPWDEGGFAISDRYTFGIWSALALSMVFITVYAFRIAAESRRMSDALTETQMALAREQRLSAVGGLAAAAAHELGTPLGTIALVAKELSRDLPEGSALADDVNLLITQSDRCREILRELSQRPHEGDGGDSPFNRMPLSALAEASAAPHRKDGVEVSVEIEPANRPGASGDGIGSEGGQPVVARNPEILHGLGNLIENAVDFAECRVALLVGWTENEIRIDLEDDGPGFDRGILGALGEPYVTTRREADGMGLGVFIAKTLLEHTGARVVFSNRGGGGARVAITWPRAILEQDEV